MVNVFLIIIGVIIFLALIAANFYILVYFQHEEDKNTAIFPKIAVIVGLTLTELNILLLPFDVANTRTNGGIPMTIIWEVFYIILAVVAVVVLPFAVFYYEAEDPDSSNMKQIRSAVIYEFITAVIFTVVSVVLWRINGVAEVPVASMTSGLTPSQNFSSCPGCTLIPLGPNNTLDFSINYVLYIISILAFIGMFLFTIFGGIGLAALPMDLINGFRNRPKRIKLSEYLKRKLELGTRSEQLLEAGKKLNDKMARTGGRPSGRTQRNEYNKFRAAVYILEEDFKKLEKSYGKGIGPLFLQILWDYTQLVLGIISIILSITWLIHIIVYVIPVSNFAPPLDGFLNNFFNILDSAFSLFGVVAYGIYSFYLLWCVIKGNFKFGLRIPLIFSIHPMKVGETLMNAFLFNTLLILLASVSVVQFCVSSFDLYSRFSGIDILFNVAVRNIRGIKYVWYYYFWALIAFAVLGMIYLFIWRSDRKQTEKGLISSTPKQ